MCGTEMGGAERRGGSRRPGCVGGWRPVLRQDQGAPAGLGVQSSEACVPTSCKRDDTPVPPMLLGGSL